MSASKKLLAKMSHNPMGWQISDIETIAKKYGIKIRKGGGSHVTFSHLSLHAILTIPARKPVKPIYIKKFLKMLEDLEL
jgi:hypothetical protein